MKLILFDIDGTLIRHVKSHTVGGWPRFIHAAREAYGVDIEINSSKNYNGWVDREILFNLVAPHGVTKKDFDLKFPLAIKAMHEHALKQDKEVGKLYEQIPEAVELAKFLNQKPTFKVGIMTGNVHKLALWKLVHADIDLDLFKLYIDADEIDDRISLAKTVFSQAQEVFDIDFLPQDVIVIGDAIGDVRCAKAIGARTIIVRTGQHSTKAELAKENPDLLVDSLMHPQVLKFLNI